MKLQVTEFTEVLKEVILWLPKNYHEGEVADILANFKLNPQVSPTSEISLDIYQAQLRVELEKEKETLESAQLMAPVLKIPDIIIQNSQNLTKALVIFIDGVQPIGVFDIEVADFKAATCFCFEGQVNAKNLGVKLAEVTIDFGIEQKQKLDILSDQIIKVPLRVGFTAELMVKTFDNFKIGGQRKLIQKVTGSELGLVLDARGRPILKPGEAGDRVRRAAAWRKDLEAPHEFKLSNVWYARKHGRVWLDEKVDMDLRVPVRKRIIEDSERLVRKLSAPGKILTKVGQNVNPEDVVAEGAKTSGFRSIPLAQSLQVSPADAGKYLKVSVGDEVSPDQIIAGRRKLFREVNIKSPVEGIVKEYNSDTGNLLLEFTTRREKLTAACWGKVLKITDNLRVEIETSTLRILGAIGAGRAREGELKILVKPNEFLIPAEVTSELAGKIIFGGARMTKAGLSKALSLNVAGIIAGGINVDDFFHAGGGKISPLGFSSDIGITLVILEGFGLRPVDARLFDLLSSYNGKFTIVDGDAAEVIIPQGEEQKASKSKEQDNKKQTTEEKKERLIGEKILAKQDIVRILDPVNLGVAGKVVAISDKKKETKLGLKTYLVEIETDSGKMVQPYTNLEVLI